MAFTIDDDATIDLISLLADRLATSKQDAVTQAVQAELDRLPKVNRKIETPEEFRKKLEDFYARFPKPEPTGDLADKAFFDDLSGESD